MKKTVLAFLAFALAACGNVAINDDDIVDRSIDMYDLQHEWTSMNWVERNGLWQLWIAADSPSWGTYAYVDFTGQYQGDVQLSGNQLLFYYRGIPWMTLDAEWRYDSVEGEDVIVLVNEDQDVFVRRGLR